MIKPLKSNRLNYSSATMHSLLHQYLDSEWLYKLTKKKTAQHVKLSHRKNDFFSGFFGEKKIHKTLAITQTISSVQKLSTIIAIACFIGWHSELPYNYLPACKWIN